MAAAPDPLLGLTVGNWRLERLLGAGGMGRVYLGVQPAIGARVAVKVLAHELSGDPRAVERFFAEARAVNLIHHENIVDVLDLAQLPDGRPYIVMEYLAGITLGAAIAHPQPVPLGTLARLTAEVLDALAAVHAAGVVHRDLKPDNVFVTPAGRAKVLDFGLAKLVSSDVRLTRSGTVVGTPAYMSPEQVGDEALDGRSDLYSVGVMLYQAATGRLPFETRVAFAMFQHHRETPPPAPRAARPELPAAYEAVILRALAKAPADRFASAHEMAAALTAAAAGLPADAFAPLPAHALADAARLGSADTHADAADRSPTPRDRAPSAAPAPEPATVALRAARTRTGHRGRAPAPQAPPAEPAGSDGKEPAWPRRHAVLLGGGAVAAAVVGAAILWQLRGRTGDERVTGIITATPDAGIAAPTVADASVASPPSEPLDVALPGVDPRRVDASALLARVAHEIQADVPDAVVTGVAFDAVAPDGSIDLTRDPSLQVTYFFQSAAMKTRGDRMPHGLPRPGCRIAVHASARQVTVEGAQRGGDTCDDPPGPPRCSAREVWQEAVRRGAPATGDVATLNYLSATATWRFRIDGEHEYFIADDCER
jgi:hypothetical protein